VPAASPVPAPLPATGAAPALAPLTALTVTLSVQMIATVAMTSPSVLAPVIAGEIGVGAQHVGWLVSLAYLAAMLSGLNGGWLALRHGSVRTSQGALAASAGGMCLMAAGHPLLLLPGALLLGVGYGLTNPAAADILSRHAPPARRGLFFSIKQTGVPLGVALAGLAMPALLALMRWPSAVLVLAAVIALAALTLGPTRRRLELAHEPAPSTGHAPASVGDAATGVGDSAAPRFADTLRTRLIAPLREVMAFPPTRQLAITSLIYALIQVSFLTFLVSMLKIEHHYTLALAASLLAASQAASVVARIGWGHVADRWVDPTRLLGMLGLAMAASMLMLGLAPADTPSIAMLGITLACAATAVSWNGVYFADLVRHVAPHKVAQTTGATQFLTFLGGMSGTAIFAGLVSLTGSYSAVFAGLALLPAITGVVLLAASRRKAALSSPAH
jgi:MFS family permease